MAEYRPSLGNEYRKPHNDLLAVANIGMRFRADKLDNLPPSAPHRLAIESYIRQLPKIYNNGKGLLLHGPLGHGKTSLACLVMREALGRGPVRAFFSPAQKLDWWARNRNELTPHGVCAWERITTAEFVTIDDVGAERDVNWNDAWLEEVVRDRYNNKLVTILTTNASLDILFKKCPWLESISRSAIKPIEVKLEEGFRD